MKLGALLVLSLLAQRALGAPGLPARLDEVLLPMAGIVGALLLKPGPRWPYVGIAVGIGWDLLMEPVIGPGGIAWSAAALTLGGVTGIIADRTAKAWFGLGALGALVVIFVRHVALLPLGVASEPTWSVLLGSTLLTGLWCGLVGWVHALDLPARWQRHRVRRLR